MLRLAVILIALLLPMVAWAQASEPPSPLHWGKPEPGSPDSPYSKAAPDLRGTKQVPLTVEVVRSDADQEKERRERENAQHKEAEEHELVKATWWLVVVTATLATFTAMLYLSTRRIAIDARETGAAALLASTAATNLARQEFVASHRPELTVREVGWDRLDMNGGEVTTYDAIMLVIANRGRNPCTIVESAFELRSGLPRGFLPPLGANALGPLTFEAGQFEARRYLITSEEEGLTVGARTLSDSYFCGTIIYEDSLKVRRRYVFLRICKRGSDDFARTDDPDHEYTD